MSCLTARTVLCAVGGVAFACAEAPAPEGPPAGPASLVFDETAVLRVSDAVGVWEILADGTRTGRTWDDALGGCDGCVGQGLEPDGDGLLAAIAVGQRDGAVARLGADGRAAWRVDGLGFPHDAVRDPDGSVIVAEAAADRLVWLDGAGRPVRELALSVPNGLERLSWGGRELALATSRGAGGGGQIVLIELLDGFGVPRWTIGVGADGGALAAPHGPLARRAPDGQGWWVLWAEAGGGGAVGVAQTDDLLAAPTPLAALVPPDDAPFGFLRGVELTGDGWLLLTDSRDPAGGGGRVLTAPVPAIDGPTVDPVALEPPQVLVPDLVLPFEARLAPR